jgi:hypothetical protein
MYEYIVFYSVTLQRFLVVLVSFPRLLSCHYTLLYLLRDLITCVLPVYLYIKNGIESAFLKYNRLVARVPPDNNLAAG